MKILSIVLFGLMLWSFMEFLMGFIIWRKRFAIRKQLRVEEARRHFAEARNTLIHLGFNGMIDVNSLTFKYLYILNTQVMRRPDQYPEISERVRRVFLNAEKSRDKNPIFQEAKSWNEETKEVVKLTAKAMLYLSYIFSLKLRIIAWLEDHFSVLSGLCWVLEYFLECLDRNKNGKTLSEEIRQSQESMNNLCHVG